MRADCREAILLRFYGRSIFIRPANTRKCHLYVTPRFISTLQSGNPKKGEFPERRRCCFYPILTRERIKCESPESIPPFLPTNTTVTGLDGSRLGRLLWSGLRFVSSHRPYDFPGKIVMINNCSRRGSPLKARREFQRDTFQSKKGLFHNIMFSFFTTN